MFLMLSNHISNNQVHVHKTSEGKGESVRVSVRMSVCVCACACEGDKVYEVFMFLKYKRMRWWRW